MRERVRLVNGEITFHATPSAGTLIVVRVPLCATEAAKVELHDGCPQA